MQNSINVFGCTIYLVLIILFFGISRVPGTKSGSGWWSAALLFALLARVSLSFIDPTLRNELTTIFYFAFGTIEKPLLIIGLIKFLDTRQSTVIFWVIALLLESWLLVVWYFEWSVWMIRPLAAGIFCLMMTYIAVLCFKNRRAFPSGIMAGVAFFSLIFAINWGTAYPITMYFPNWVGAVLIIGSVSKMGLYLSLLAGVFLSFKKRLERAEADALHLAHYDALTGMHNKLYLDGIFEHMARAAERSGTLLAVIFIDLDDFKPINDTAGHEVGDRVLVEVAKRINDGIRGTDTCARIGGDEFVVLAGDFHDESQPLLLANKLIKQIQQEIVIGAAEFTVGVSIGIALFPNHGQDIATLIKASDMAMYKVKKSGKMSVCLYDD